MRDVDRESSANVGTATDTLPAGGERRGAVLDVVGALRADNNWDAVLAIVRTLVSENADLARRLARRQRALPRAWQTRRAFLVGRPFDAAHCEATESLKLKRQAIAEHFRDRIAALADGKVVTVAPLQEMLACAHPWVRSYFHGKRALRFAAPPASDKPAP